MMDEPTSRANSMSLKLWASRPLMRTLPDMIGFRRSTALNSVVLPIPFGPSRQRMEPEPTLVLNPLTTARPW